MNVIGLWWLALGLMALTIVVVALLLLWIAAAAKRIERHALAVWEAGKGIAANTVQIWQLQKTNETATAILHTAQEIAAVAQSIDGRLARLPEALRGKV